MKNLIKIGKFLLLYLIILMAFNVVWIGYTYITCSNAMDDTLENIALIVAEDNCIDTSKMDSVRELMVKNAPIWLTYNAAGMNEPGAGDPKFSKQPTNIVQTSLATAKSNVKISDSSSGDNEFLALKMCSSGSTTHSNSSDYYSYADCPNRGQTITITLSANVNIYLLTMIPSIRQQSIPITKQITVVGMKFYKGKEET